MREYSGRCHELANGFDDFGNGFIVLEPNPRLIRLYLYPVINCRGKGVGDKLKMNRGRIVITECNQQAHLDYRANIDVGYPNTVTRHYKKKFVLEFLNAIYEEIQTPGDRAALNRIH